MYNCFFFPCFSLTAMTFDSCIPFGELSMRLSHFTNPISNARLSIPINYVINAGLSTSINISSITVNYLLKFHIIEYIPLLQ